MAAMDTFQDNFDFGGVDSGKWSTFGGGISAGTGLNVAMTTSNNYIGMDSLTTYNLTSSYAYSQVVSAGDQSLASFEVYPVYLKKDASNNLYIRITGNQVACLKTVATVNTQIGSNVAYNPTTMKYFRISESGGNTSFQYASDPSGTWTNLVTAVANPITVTALTFEILTGTWNNENSTAYYDNVNVTPNQYKFNWMGYTWNKRIHAGPAANNQTFSAANVGTPNSNGIILSLSNAGAAPIGCEFFSEQRGWGYGIYTATVQARLDTAHAAVGFGNMFTFDFTAPPDYREIDMGEIKPYLGLSAKQILYNHTYNNNGSNTFITNYTAQASDTVQTHQCIWTPNNISFTTYAGPDTSGVVRNHFDHISNIPVPNLERVHFNVFVDPSVSGYADATAIDILIKSFSFEPYKVIPVGIVRR